VRMAKSAIHRQDIFYSAHVTIFVASEQRGKGVV
jgi:hypothetical protein